MKLTIDYKNNSQYAKISVKTYRVDGKVHRDVIYLGRVIDREKGVFFSKERGYFTYDVKTGKYGNVGPEHPGGRDQD